MRFYFLIPCFLVLVAGCGFAPSGTPSTGQSSTPGETPEMTMSETLDGGTATPTCEPNPLSADLEITLNANIPVQIIVLESDTERTNWEGPRSELTPVATGSAEIILNETYPADMQRVKFDGGSGVFESATDYRVTIRANGSIRWGQIVRRDRVYDLTVHRDGNVSQDKPPGIVESPTPTC